MTDDSFDKYMSLTLVSVFTLLIAALVVRMVMNDRSSQRHHEAIMSGCADEDAGYQQ